MTILNQYAPTNDAFVDPKTGKLTVAGQIWMREIWRRTGGAIAQNGHFILDEGTTLPTRTALNFTGPGVTAFDDGSQTVVQIAGPIFLDSGGDSGDEFSFSPPGNNGADGATGAQGAIGPALFLIGEGEDGEPGPPGPPGQSSAVTADIYTLATDESTAADTNPISLTGLAWDVVAGATYAFRLIGNVSPAAATTGCGFQLLVT